MYRKVKTTVIDEVNQHPGAGMSEILAGLRKRLGEDRWYTKATVHRLIENGQIKVVGDKLFPQLEYHVQPARTPKYTIGGE